MEKSRLWLLMIALLCIVLCCLSQISIASSEDSGAPQSIDELKVRIDSLMAEYELPGIGVAIVSKDSIEWIGCFGYANLETGEPITENTLFRVESCTKSFLGLGFLKLMEDGKIDINTPVREIVPDIDIRNRWVDTHPVRVIHLLEQTSSFDDISPSWMVNTIDPDMPPKRALELKAEPMKVRWQPGTRYSYSGRGFTLAGYVMEKITGQRYEDYVTENILIPIGMTNSSLRVTEKAKQLLAQGYDKKNVPMPYMEGYDRPASSLLTSTKDIALFLNCILNRGKIGGRQVLREESIDRLGVVTTTDAARAGLTLGYTFGVGASHSETFTWRGHSGGGIGFLSEYYYIKDEGIGYVVLCNAFSPPGYMEITDAVTEYIIHDIEPAHEPPPVTLSAEQLRQYTGYFQFKNPRQQLTQFVNIIIGGVTISLKNDTLYTQWFMEGKKPLIPVSSNTFRRPDQNRATRIFTTNSTGEMVYAPLREYYVRTGHWKLYTYIALFFGAWIFMISTIPYALVWIPIHLVKKFKGNDNRCKYLPMRTMPLITVLTLTAGFMVLIGQSMLGVCQLSWQNVVNYVFTLLFVPFSALSLLFTILSFRKPVKKFARIYALLVSISLVGMSVYLSWYGVIGFRNWAD